MDLANRISALEQAIMGLGVLELGGEGSGPNEGHPFEGNQYQDQKEQPSTEGGTEPPKKKRTRRTKEEIAKDKEEKKNKGEEEKKPKEPKHEYPKNIGKVKSLLEKRNPGMAHEAQQGEHWDDIAEAVIKNFDPSKSYVEVNGQRWKLY